MRQNDKTYESGYRSGLLVGAQVAGYGILFAILVLIVSIMFGGRAKADERYPHLWAASQQAVPAAARVAGARSGVPGLVTAAAARHGVPVALALRVARVESSFNCNARGQAGELGPLQIKPATARGLGYRGPVAALRSCGAGLEWGMRHLAVAYRRCGTVHGAATLHNRGLGARCVASAYSRRALGAG